ncbi:MAG TPA: 16S rRNA (guanine(527)-N(7))-methyltransferase RsmG [Actinomyces sp.]|nr:16S rRNA (guanine(527)-N(7))-methyltransferase RsmG [Acidobacteriota bacterium]HHT40446.1 16S rRNA (guanine(527)-N(7))-methyltransferase RsmG [Actinomyces sp.]
MTEQSFEVASDGDSVVEEPTEAVRELFGQEFSRINHFAQMLIDEGELRGLIGPRELPRLWSRHLVNSAAVLGFIPENVQVMDIGSGAGFPGLVIAISRPDLDVHLVEPMQRRCEWLADVVDEIGIDNVTIHNDRAEELHGLGQSDIVTSRAVANLKKLTRLTMPLVLPGGSMLALKGRKAADEVKAARPAFKKLQVDWVKVHEVPSVMEDESTRVVELRKKR